MATLKLAKGISYSGAVSATQSNPFVEVDDPETVAYLISDGRFEVIPEPEAHPDLDDDETPEDNADDDETPDGIIGDDPEPEEHTIPTPEELEAMTKPELKAWADAHDIDTSACKTKADIMEAISVWGGGSYTMMDIQKAPNYKEEE